MNSVMVFKILDGFSLLKSMKDGLSITLTNKIIVTVIKTVEIQEGIVHETLSG